MGFPLALHQLHVAEYCFKGRVLRRTGVNSKSNFFVAPEHMTYSHLGEMNPVAGTLNTVIVFSSAQTVPHGFYIRVNSRSGPVGISLICHNASKMLELFIFIFDRAFQSVFAVKIHNNATLVKTVMAFRKICFYHKAKIFFFCFHLKNRRIPREVKPLYLHILPEKMCWDFLLPVFPVKRNLPASPGCGWMSGILLVFSENQQNLLIQNRILPILR